VPVRLLMKDRFRSDLRANKVTAPVLVVHGDNDLVVPMALGKSLYSLIRAPKRFVSVAGAGHNNLGARAVSAAKNSSPINGRHSPKLLDHLSEMFWRLQTLFDNPQPFDGDTF
jgi:fermentation-respiration switch protein FrsA (DUF1100 family)